MMKWLSSMPAENELENKNFKFARSMLYNARCPGIKDGIGFCNTLNLGYKISFLISTKFRCYPLISLLSFPFSK
jgi:hypothetical protein